MNTRILNVFSRDISNHQKGFTLLETMVALLILLAALAGMVPLFITHRLSAVNNDIETGANAIAQRVMDELRNTNWDDIKDRSGVETALPNGPSGTTPIASTYKGKDYDVKINYCPADAVPAGVCAADINTQFIRVEVEYNDQEVFQTETIYTNLE